MKKERVPLTNQATDSPETETILGTEVVFAGCSKAEIGARTLAFLSQQRESVDPPQILEIHNPLLYTTARISQIIFPL